MTETILMVDDEERALRALKRSLGTRFRIDTALGGAEGLAAIEERGPYAVVVSDMRMPEMNGVEFLSRVKARAALTVRMMLTGDADWRTAARAVNDGHIFRFLTKPCPADVLQKALEGGLRQYRLQVAERELLENTVSAGIEVLAEILAIVDTRSFDFSQSLLDSVERVGRALGVEKMWELRVATMLLDLGKVSVPPAILSKANRRQRLSQEEAVVLERAAKVGSDLLRRIPRLEGVAEIVCYQGKRFDGSGYPDDARRGESIPLGARILKVVVDLAGLRARLGGDEKAWRELRTRRGWYDPRVLEYAERTLLARVGVDPAPVAVSVAEVTVRELRVGHVLACDVRTDSGKVLIATGHEISEALLTRVRNFAKFTPVREPIQVIIRQESRVICTAER